MVRLDADLAAIREAESSAARDEETSRAALASAEDKRVATDANFAEITHRAAEARAKLKSLSAAPPDPVHGHKLRYSHPATGGHAFLTLSACMQLLPKGFSGRPWRATDGTVFHVAQGGCRVEMGGQVQAVRVHDSFVLPPWEACRLQADEDCFIFSFSDRAAQEALGYWREERL